VKRSFFVKLNLDEVGHAIIEYDDAASLGQWFRGYLIGAHGKPLRQGSSDAYVAGHAYGLISFQETEQFRNKQAAIANLRWHPDAKQMPSHMPDSCPVSMPDSCHSDGIEHRASSIENREAIIDQPRAGVDPAEVFATSPDSGPIDTELRYPYEIRLPWAVAIRDVVGSKLSRTNWTNWKRLTDEHGAESVRRAAKSVDADKRWPDAVEVALEAARKRHQAAKGQARPTGPDPEAARRIDQEATAEAIALLSTIEAGGEADTKAVQALYQAVKARRGVGFAMARVRAERPDMTTQPTIVDPGASQTAQRASQPAKGNP